MKNSESFRVRYFTKNLSLVFFFNCHLRNLSKNSILNRVMLVHAIRFDVSTEGCIRRWRDKWRGVAVRHEAVDARACEQHPMTNAVGLSTSTTTHMVDQIS
jgi:hypothetical protein